MRRENMPLMLPTRAGAGLASEVRLPAVDETLESDTRFRIAFDHAAIGMALVSLDGRWLEVNKSLCRMTGYSEAELLATTFQAITHPEDLDADLAYVKQILAGEILEYHMTKRYLHKQGRLVWVLLSVALVRDAQQKPLYFIAQIQDVTERKRVEEALRASEEEYRATFESAGVGKLQLDIANGKFLRVNAKMAEICGYSVQELLGFDYTQLSHPQDVEMTREALACLIRGEVREAAMEKRLVRKDGRVIWVGLTLSLLRQNVGHAGRAIATVQDITSRKLSEWMEQDRRNILELVAKDAPLSQVLDELSTAVERQVDASFAAVLLIDGGEVSIFGQRLPEDLRFSLNDHSLTLVRQLAAGIWSDTESCGVTRVEQDETWEWARQVTQRHQIQTCWASAIQSADATPLGILLVFSTAVRRPETTELRALDMSVKLAGVCIDHHNTTRQLAHLVRHDALTGLPNRILFEDRVQQAIAVARRTGKGVGLMVLDIDKFKTINDTHGHHAGDHLLQQFAHRLRSRLRESDTMARLGGDEFVVVLPELVNRNHASAAAEKLVSCLTEPFQIGELAVNVTTSIGIAIFPTDADDAASLLKKADGALYRMKEKGRNGYSY